MLKKEIKFYEHCHKSGSCIIPNTYCTDCEYYEECNNLNGEYYD